MAIGVRGMRGLQIFLWFAGMVAVEAACLPNATAVVDRKNLTNVAANQSYAVGIWRNGDYAAAYLTARVVQIMVEEMLGFNVELKGPGGLTADTFFALMGCTSPLDGVARGCGPNQVTHVHICVEVWTAGYAEVWDQVQVEYRDAAPKNLGNMGYVGQVSLYVPWAVQQKAYHAEGMNLDFYRDYNTSWRSPAKYFAAPSDLDKSKLMPCAETALMDSGVMSNYAQITGDLAGVVTDEQGALIGKCFDDYFFYTPACRDDAGTCLTWLTGGTGWGFNEMLTKAGVFNMPLAAAVASSFESYATLPSDYDLMLYWWVPDPTFLRLNPEKVVFPAHNADAWAAGDRSSASKDTSIDRLVSQDLHSLAPEIEEFMSRFQVSLESVNQMMLDQLDTKDNDLDVACRWLQSNTDRWTKWLPEKGKCFSQFGMYSEKDRQFLQVRKDVSITCKACPSGFYSSQLEDDQGITFICQRCPSGSFQPSGASVSCTLCPAGSYQNETGSLECLRCPVGQYQDDEGQIRCKPCPSGGTTLLLGSDSILQCGCIAGSINTGGDALECIPCGEGLDCPFSSSILTLQSGQPSSERLVTKIQSGYFATAEAPLKLFRCRPPTWCPGGAPGTCAGGLQGKPCAYCSNGKSWSGEECQDCGVSAVGWVVALLLVLTGTPIVYTFTNLAVTAQATPFKTAQMAAGLAVATLQIVALLGLTSAKWPGTFEDTSSGLQFLVLDVESLRLSCFIGGTSATSYVGTALMCPFVLLWLCICHVLSHTGICPRRMQRWKMPYTLNTMGLGLQLGFGTISAVALKPMMCYQHPNGRHSVLSYPSIFCGESDHGLMLGFGIALLALFVLGFVVACCYAAWNLPRWSVQGEHSKVQSFRFCTSNFRFDAYAFIIPLLGRGLGFALAIVAGTNLPPLQTSLASIVLAIYIVLQASLRPWKVPAINVADTILSASLLILAGRSIQVNGEMEAEFAEYFTVILLLLIGACLAALVLLCAAAMALQFLGGDWSRLLNLGSHNPQKITEALKQCAEELLELETAQICGKIETMNYYDVTTILNLIRVVGADFQDENRRTPLFERSSLLDGRVALASLNARLSVNLGETPDSDASGAPSSADAGLEDAEGSQPESSQDGSLADAAAEVNRASDDQSVGTEPGEDAKSNIVKMEL